MKFNKWTLGLAAVGVVSLASVAQAEEKTLDAVKTAISATTISGYVDTSAQWNFGTGNEFAPPYKFGGPNKADGFNLNVVQLSISKPLDEAQWAAGYKVDLWFGPDANQLRTLSSSAGGGFNEPRDFAVRQAYVALRVPVGNGLDLKVGVFDSIIGYESVEDGNNPNHTRSYGHSIEPQTHTGVLATYRFCDMFAASAGVANTVGPIINQRAFGFGGSDGEKAESYKTYMASVALTAPQSWGSLAGSTLYGGVVNGYNEDVNGADIAENTTSWYAGATVATPVTGLKVGAAFDYIRVHGWSANYNEAWALGGYASYQATEKLSLHLRGEYVEDEQVFSLGSDYGSGRNKIIALTGTIQYDLWQNVISRLEFRWDHSANGLPAFGKYGYNSSTSSYGPTMKNAAMLALNVIYKF